MTVFGDQQGAIVRDRHADRPAPNALIIGEPGRTVEADPIVRFASDAGHPVHAAWQESRDPLETVFRAIDEAVGAIADGVPDDCYFVLFSVNGAGSNVGRQKEEGVSTPSPRLKRGGCDEA